MQNPPVLPGPLSRFPLLGSKRRRRRWRSRTLISRYRQFMTMESESPYVAPKPEFWKQRNMPNRFKGTQGFFNISCREKKCGRLDAEPGVQRSDLFFPRRSSLPLHFVKAPVHGSKVFRLTTLSLGRLNWQTGLDRFWDHIIFVIPGGAKRRPGIQKLVSPPGFRRSPE